MILLIKEYDFGGGNVIHYGAVDEAGNPTGQQCWGLRYNATQVNSIIQGGFHASPAGEILFLATEQSEIEDKLAELELTFSGTEWQPPVG